MRDFLKTYTITLTTKGPLFVGSGEELKKNGAVFRTKPNQYSHKKESIVDNVYVFDQKTLMEWAEKEGKLEALAEILSDSNGDLNQLFSHFKSKDKYPSRYFLKVDTSIQMRNRANILLFIKDAYGQPYVPGSSLKGALRRAILHKLIAGSSPEWKNFQSNLEGTLKTCGYNETFQREGRELNAIGFYDLHRPEIQQSDMLNDFMSGIRISDSVPLRCDETGSQLQVYQKLDVFSQGENALNVYRECVKENVEICFTMTIDHSVADFSGESILRGVDDGFLLDAIGSSYQYDQKMFHSHCPTGKNSDLRTGPYLYLGGGAGYITKTVSYDLLGRDTVEHYGKKLGISHTYKKSKVNGQYKSFGLCKVDIKEKK